MKVESSSYESYLEALQAWQEKMQQAKISENEENGTLTDAYVPDFKPEDMPIPSGNYDANGMMSGERPPMPPMPPMEETEETTGTTSSTEEELLSELSDIFRANTDSILATMEELGLTLEDLQDEENMEKLATAMHEGAVKLGISKA